MALSENQKYRILKGNNKQQPVFVAMGEQTDPMQVSVNVSALLKGMPNNYLEQLYQEIGEILRERRFAK